MPSEFPDSPVNVVCLAGATGSGKTALAIELSDIWGCEVINADSRQLYRDFPLITAQPSKMDLKKAVHHLYGILDSTEKLNAAQWASMAARKAKEINARGKIPLVVGGTGFYLRVLLEGLAEMPPVPPEISQVVRERMNGEGSVSLYAALSGIDPDWARKIHPHDRQRIMRGLEVYEASGKPLSWWQKHGATRPFARGPCFFLDIALERLEPLLAARIDQMIEAGALQEALRAHVACPDIDAPGWSGIGCREALDLAIEATDYGQGIASWFFATRAYAKRQLTWFRGRKGICRISEPARLLEYARKHSAFAIPGLL